MAFWTNQFSIMMLSSGILSLWAPWNHHMQAPTGPNANSGLYIQVANRAIEQIVIPKGQPVELLPRSSEILALQMTVVEGYKLVAEKVGAELNKRLRILPLHASIKESITSDLNATEVQQTPVKDVDVCKITAGTTVARLPFLQD